MLTAAIGERSRIIGSCSCQSGIRVHRRPLACLWPLAFLPLASALAKHKHCRLAHLPVTCDQRNHAAHPHAPCLALSPLGVLSRLVLARLASPSQSAVQSLLPLLHC